MLRKVKQENSFMKDNGFKINCKDMEHTISLMELFTEVIGGITSLVDKEFMSFQTGLSTKANGKIIWCMELVSLLTLMGENGVGNIEKQNLKVKTKLNWLSKKQ